MLKRKKMVEPAAERVTWITDPADLQKAYDGSWYTIIGAGGDLKEWVEGYEKLLAEAECGKPEQWYAVNGATVNCFMEPSDWQNVFQGDLVLLLFPLTGMAGNRLPIFKLQMQDRWFDDVVDNARRSFR